MAKPSSAELAVMYEIWQDKIKSSKRTDVYKTLLRRRYRNPHGYLEWERYAAELTAIYETSIYFGRMDYTQKTLSRLVAGFFQEQGPIYWLREQLAQALWHSDLPAQLPELQQSIRRAVIMLPKAEWLADPDGFIPQYILVQHEVKGCAFPDLTLPNGDIVKLHAPAEDFIKWATPLPMGGTYAGNSALKGDELDVDTIDRHWREEENVITTSERCWSQSVTRLVYQCLLLLQIQPEFVDHLIVPTTAKPAKKPSRKDRMLDPRWLGTGFEIKTVMSKEHGGGTHASPMTHWRRGHWRRVAVGEGRKGQKIVWIQPTLVNA